VIPPILLILPIPERKRLRAIVGAAQGAGALPAHHNYQLHRQWQRPRDRRARKTQRRRALLAHRRRAMLTQPSPKQGSGGSSQRSARRCHWQTTIDSDTSRVVGGPFSTPFSHVPEHSQEMLASSWKTVRSRLPQGRGKVAHTSASARRPFPSIFNVPWGGTRKEGKHNNMISVPERTRQQGPPTWGRTPEQRGTRDTADTPDTADT
jgi:hypothetical protein